MIYFKEHVSDFEFTTDTTHLDLRGELWDVFCENSKEEIESAITWFHIILMVYPYQIFGHSVPQITSEPGGWGGN